MRARLSTFVYLRERSKSFTGKGLGPGRRGPQAVSPLVVSTYNYLDYFLKKGGDRGLHLPIYYYNGGVLRA